MSDDSKKLHGLEIIKKTQKNKYLNEKIQNIKTEKDILTGSIAFDKIDELWKARYKPEKLKSTSEQKYSINEILRKYVITQEEKKGYNSKYVQELTDLLGNKDKNFPKKRITLYNNRISKLNKLPNNNSEKYILLPRKTITLHHNDKTYDKNIPCQTNIHHSPIKPKSLKYNIHANKNKGSSKNFNNSKNKNLFSSLYVTQVKQKNDEKFDAFSLYGREEFLATGDKEKYRDYLKCQYNFFELPKLTHIKFLEDKRKRILLYKKSQDSKFLNRVREDPFKTEIFNRIKRENNNNNMMNTYEIKRKPKKRIFEKLNCNSLYQGIYNNIYKILNK